MSYKQDTFAPRGCKTRKCT